MLARSLASIYKKTSLQSLVKSSTVKYTTQSVGKLVRSSNPGLRAVVFGAYGQVGRYVVSLLAGSGVQCVIPYRGDE
jgi:hypothetical protein